MAERGRTVAAAGRDGPGPAQRRTETSVTHGRLGFLVPKDDPGLILLAEAAAEDLGVQRLYLDQLLW